MASDIESYEISFEAEVTPNDIDTQIVAIDDISIRQGECIKHPGDCNFDEPGFCGWSNFDANTFNWLLHQAGNSVSETAPLIDQ